VTFPSLKKYLLCRINEPSWSAAAPVPGDIVVDVDVLLPFGSITCEAVWVGMESTEITVGVFKIFGEMMCLMRLQVTLRVAMR